MPAANTQPTWMLIAAMAVLTAAGFLITGLRADPTSHRLLILPFGMLSGTWWFYRSLRPDPRVQTLAISFLQILLILVFGTLLSYAAVALRFPLQDNNLLAIDTALGIDRRLYLDFIGDRRWLHNAVVLAYFTLMPQFVLVPLVLFFANQVQRLRQFTLAAGIALLATVAISVFTPALSSVYLDLGLPAGAALPANMGVHIPIIEKLRSGLPYLVRLDELEGLVTFPSFHTIGALLFIWATWRVKVVRWLSLVLNAALIAGTPIVGTHYFIDIAAGAVVALIAVLASRRLSARAECVNSRRPFAMACARSPASGSTVPVRSGPC